MLAGQWEKEREDWLAAGTDPRPPVFILVCKNTRIAKVIHGSTRCWNHGHAPPQLPGRGLIRSQ